MSREQLLQLIRDAEADPDLRVDLRQAYANGGRWRGLLQRARDRGYTVSDGDLAEARAADQAARFLQGSRLAALRPLWGSTPVLPDQVEGSERRRQASTAR